MKSAIIEEFKRRQVELLSNPEKFKEVLFRDGRNREAKRDQAQARLLVVMATDEELAEMAKIENAIIDKLDALYQTPLGIRKTLEEFKQLRAELQASADTWRRYLASSPKGKGGE